MIRNKLSKILALIIIFIFFSVFLTGCQFQFGITIWGKTSENTKTETGLLLEKRCGGKPIEETFWSEKEGWLVKEVCYWSSQIGCYPLTCSQPQKIQKIR